MPKPVERLVVLGAKAFREIAEIIRDINHEGSRFEVEAILDDNPATHGQSCEGVSVAGSLDCHVKYPNARFVLAIGSNRNYLVRYRVLARLGIPADRFATLVHPAAKVFSTATVGFGCVIFPGTQVFCEARLDNFVHIMGNTVIGVANRVGEGAMFGALTTTAADVRIGPYAYIGMACAIKDGVSIGAGAQVGMGTVLLRDVAAGTMVFGSPPRVWSRLEVPSELTSPEVNAG